MEMLLVYWNLTWVDHYPHYSTITTQTECFAMTSYLLRRYPRRQLISVFDPAAKTCRIGLYNIILPD